MGVERESRDSSFITRKTRALNPGLILMKSRVDSWALLCSQATPRDLLIYIDALI